MSTNTNGYKPNYSESESSPFNEVSDEDNSEVSDEDNSEVSDEDNSEETYHTKDTLNESGPFLYELQHTKSTQFKCLLSVCTAFAFCILGWTKGQLGPAFLDILLICNTTLDKGSIIMTSYFIGRVIGSILGGAVYSKCNRYLILIVALTTNSSMFAAIPWCTTYEVMISAHVIHGISGGVMSVTLISIAASIWGASVRGRVYMNSFYAAFAVSGFLSPMVTSKFLVPTDVIRYDTSLNNSRITVNNISWKSSYYIPIQRNNLTDTDELNSSLYLAYLISAGLAFCSALPFAAIYLKKQNSSFKQQNKDELQFIGRLPTWTKILQLINVGVFAAVFISLDFTFSGYLTVFCVQHLQWKKTSGSMLTSVAFIALLSGRIGGAVLTHYLKPLTMLMISIGLCSVGFVGFLLSAVYLDHTGIWISVCVLGIPMGVVWPCLLSWINEKLIPLRGKIAAYVMIASFMGALFSPMLFGYMMEEISPLWFCFLSLGKTVVAIISVVFIVIYTRCQSRLESKQSND